MEPRPWHKNQPQRPMVWEKFESWDTQFGELLPTIDALKEDRPIIFLL